MSKALLLIDIQNDYFPGGALELAGSSAAGAKAGELLQAFRRKALPIIHIQHISVRPEAGFFLPESVGAEIHSIVTPARGEAVFQKNHPNSFYKTPLLRHLRDHGLSELVIAGMMTQMCIDTTTRAASELGFKPVLAHDACAAMALSFGGAAVSAEVMHTAFMAALHGFFAKVLSVEEICAAL